MSDTLKILFPGIEKIFSENPENKLKGEISFPQIQNLDASITALDEGLTPEELQFFLWGIAIMEKRCIVRIWTIEIQNLQVFLRNQYVRI